MAPVCTVLGSVAFWSRGVRLINLAVERSSALSRIGTYVQGGTYETINNISDSIFGLILVGKMCTR